MKSLLICLFLIITTCCSAQQKICLTSTHYHTIDGLGIHKYSKTSASIVINHDYIAYYSPISGLRSMKVFLSDSKAVKGATINEYISVDKCFSFTITTPGDVEIQEMCGAGRAIIIEAPVMESLTFELFVKKHE